MSAYEPGTVAVATVRGVPNVGVMRGSGAFGHYWFCDRLIHGSESHFHECVVTDVRPLVVLDLGASPPKHSVAGVLRAINHPVTHWLADQIEAQTRPPKPAEPTNRYAVVRDGSGEEWLRDRRGDWCQVNHPTHGTRVRQWGDIDAVAVLSEGVA